MDRLLWAGCTAAVAIGAIVLNVVRYPAVTEMLDPAASPVPPAADSSADRESGALAAAISPTSAGQPVASPPAAWSNAFPAVAPFPTRAAHDEEWARATPSLPPMIGPGFAKIETPPPDSNNVVAGDVAWAAESGAPPKADSARLLPDRGVVTAAPAMTVAEMRISTPEGPGELVPVQRRPAGAAAVAVAVAVAENEPRLQRLPPVGNARTVVVDLSQPLPDGTLPGYPMAAGR